MRCNGCQEDLAETKQQCVATTCLHIFCGTCIQKIVETESGCPVCENVITKNNIKLVRVAQDAQAFKLALCGQSPDVALSSALNAVKFYITQQALQADLQAARLHQKLEKMRVQCNARLQEVHDGYLKAKRKYKEIADERNKLVADNQELQQKYSQKAAQSRKLQDMFQTLQHENEALRSQGGRGGQLQNLLVGSPSHINNSNGGGQLVTTFQRKQVYLGEDTHDILGQRVLDHGRQETFQGFFSGSGQGIRGGMPTPQRIFGELADPIAKSHRTSPSVSPLLAVDTGLTPPTKPNHLGHLLGGAPGYSSSQKRGHDVFRTSGGRHVHGPSSSGRLSL
eukprot:jgi/Botrbrau1/8733/Bobra.0090s0009.1